jgi:hypothetical protein
VFPRQGTVVNSKEMVEALAALRAPAAGRQRK